MKCNYIPLIFLITIIWYFITLSFQLTRTFSQSFSFFLSHSVMSDCLRPHGPYSPWNSLGWSTGVVSLSLLQGIFPTQGSNSGLPHCRWILYQLSHREVLHKTSQSYIILDYFTNMSRLKSLPCILKSLTFTLFGFQEWTVSACKSCIYCKIWFLLTFSSLESLFLPCP